MTAGCSVVSGSTGSDLALADVGATGSSIPTVIPPTFVASQFANDFVVTGAESGSGSEFYFPSQEDGTFGTRSTIVGLGSVDGLDVADMDGDGDNDILICDGGAQEVYLYTSNGAGSFAPTLIVSGVSSGGFCTNLRVGDFNEDGTPDLVVGDNRVTNGMFVYLQTAPGIFTKVTPGLGRRHLEFYRRQLAVRSGQWGRGWGRSRGRSGLGLFRYRGRPDAVLQGG